MSDSRHDPVLDLDADDLSGAGARAGGLRLDAEPPGADPGTAGTAAGPGAAARAGPAGEGAAWAPTDDPLLQCLVWLTRHHGRERSAEALMGGTAIDGRLAPDIALRVLRESGYKAGIIRRSLADIHGLLLPVVLLMRDGEACLLVRRHDTPDGTRHELVMPDTGFPVCVASDADLADSYTGFAIAATPDLAAGQPDPTDDLQEPGRHWLWGTLRRFMPYYRASMVAALLSNVMMLAFGLVTSVVFDKVIPHQAMATLWALAVGAGIALLFDLLARQLRAHLIDLAGRKSDLIIGSLLFRQALGVRMEHRPTSAGSYAHILAQIEVVREFFASATLSALSDLPFILLFVGMVFVLGGPLGWVLVIAIPVITILAWAVQAQLRRSTQATMARQADLHGTLVEAVEGLEDLKAAGAQGRFLRQYEETTAQASEAQLRTRTLSAWINNVAAIAQQAVTLIMLVWGVYLIQDQVISGGALIGCVMFAARAIAPLGGLVSLATRYQGARAAMIALDQQMKAPVEREAGRAYVPQPRIRGRLALTGVSFAYPAPDGQQAVRVLKEVGLRFEPGERVAILGRIGSGKSTILRLLAGLYQPGEGMVEVDGVDLRQIDPVDYRAKVGFVTQEPRLFAGTLRDNVLLGRAWADPAQLPVVAKLTGLDRLVNGHPQGWDLPVGEMGGLLSGGQRQLVALARCLVTRPQILLMDEPTSSMDAQSEVAFLRRLHQAAGDCTLIMVTHRPAVLELVNRIVVIEGGKVLADGPKAKVLAALSGKAPMPQQAAAAGTGTNGPAPGANVHMHPGAQPVQQPPVL